MSKTYEGDRHYYLENGQVFVLPAMLGGLYQIRPKGA